MPWSLLNTTQAMYPRYFVQILWAGADDLKASDILELFDLDTGVNLWIGASAGSGDFWIPTNQTSFNYGKEFNFGKLVVGLNLHTNFFSSYSDCETAYRMAEYLNDIDEDCRAGSATFIRRGVFHSKEEEDKAVEAARSVYRDHQVH